MKKLMDLFNLESPAETTNKDIKTVNRMKGSYLYPVDGLPRR
jgi:hypothetical protein